MKFITTPARNLQPGDWYLGRKEWHIRVDNIIQKRTGIEVVGRNAYGEGRIERYKDTDTVELIQYRS